jgi:nicotinamide-nucleotide amidase
MKHLNKMKQEISAGIINIGDEILIGQIINTNSACIAKQLNAINIPVAKIVVVGDNQTDIIRAFEEMLSSVDIVFVTGGLGTTNDDITKECICNCFDKKRIPYDDVIASLKKRLQSRNTPLTQSILSQAMLPEGCEAIDNNCGLAPGIWIEQNEKILIAAPGVPLELESMMPAIIEKIESRYRTEQHIIHKHIQTSGIAEAALSDMLLDFEKQLPPHIQLAYLPKMGYTSLRLSGYGKVSTVLEKEMEHQLSMLSQVAKEYIFSCEDKTLPELIADKLNAAEKTLALAESCTGGYIAHLITSLAGSSSFFKGGAVAYSNEIKTKVLGVNPSTLDSQGAVSEETVKEMVVNLLNIFQADYGIAVSGIAGPTGGSEEKPTGTVWIAVAGRGEVIAQVFRFGTGRDRVIRQAAIRALLMLYKFIAD